MPPSEVDPIIAPDFHLDLPVSRFPTAQKFPTSQRRLSLGSALTSSSQPRKHRLRSFALDGKRLVGESENIKRVGEIKIKPKVRKGEAVVEASRGSPTASCSSLCSGSPPTSSRRWEKPFLPFYFLLQVLPLHHSSLMPVKTIKP